jgi:hypothetical protein
MAPHSKTVRGTSDNPITKDAIANNKMPPQHGDPTSFQSEGKESSSGSTDGYGPPADTYGLEEGAPSVPSAFEQEKAKNNEKSHGDNYGLDKNASSRNNASTEDLPHSKKVRGTLAHSSPREVNKTMLGDPASLVSETSDTKMDRDVESGSSGVQSKL